MPKTLSRGNLVPNKSKEKETFLAVNELQKGANAVYRVGPLRITTTDAAFHDVWTSDQQTEGSIWGLTVYFLGKVAAGGGQIFWARNISYYRQPGGVTTLLGLTDVSTSRSDANMQIAVNPLGNTVVAYVGDAAARTIDWSVWVEVRVGT
jgi:hypothetical protein